ncbi:DUF3037 domain-containing protein [Pontibacter sp. KCTC 32443]|uniref:DUF3037 domain-containing protein n=1 Tax=Pontibacter TaxID=323449 RepID=UPI00164E2960|nr:MULTISPECIES: DUF3037 domain-containing protein [Pontibacter]MBC5773023.1 DUF3037 domain-containing protein [Pontibacter sp. KCTC 32443]
MQGKHLFEYAVIRVVPRVEREEFMNVGVILYCRDQGFLHSLFNIDHNRLQAFAADLDMQELQERLQAFERICCGRKEGGRIGELGIAERFRWLTAARSTIVQTSPVHPGLCTNASEMLDHLFRQLVL